MEKVIIIGSGCAGLTAAIYAARANLAPIVICGAMPGGHLTTTSQVENFPGFPNGIDGFELMNNMRSQAERFGAIFIDDVISDVSFSKEKKILTGRADTYTSISVIIASGASPKFLGIKGEREFYGGKGVSVCATCDAAFYRNKIVAVVGGGDTACEEALFLSNFCTKVYLIHRRDALRASKFMQERVLNNQKIVMIWNTVVTEILGDKTVSAVKIESVDKDVEYLSCSGFFLAIGHTPNTKPFEKCILVDSEGYIKPKPGTFVETNIDGVFVAGDCADKVFRQAITSAGTGAMAAIAAEKFICTQK